MPGFENSANAQSTEKGYKGKSPNSKGNMKTQLHTVHGCEGATKSGGESPSSFKKPM